MADELVLVHPGHTDTATVLVVVAGPFLFLLGCACFKWVMSDRPLPPFSHLGGLALLSMLLPLALAQLLSAWLLGALTTLVLIIVAVWETRSLRVGANV